MKPEDSMRLVRLWVNGEDYGVMVERAAEMYREIHERRYPDEPLRIEPVTPPAERLVREHRGSFAESMKTVRPVRDRKHLAAIIRETLGPFGHSIEPDQITVEPYGGLDSRIGWDTYLISIKSYGVWGMANGPI